MSVVAGVTLFHVRRPWVPVHTTRPTLTRIILWNVLLRGGRVPSWVATRIIGSSSPLVIARVSWVHTWHLTRHPTARVSKHTRATHTLTTTTHHVLLLLLRLLWPLSHVTRVPTLLTRVSTS